MIAPENKSQEAKSSASTTSAGQGAPIAEGAPSYSEATSDAGASSEPAASIAPSSVPHADSATAAAPEQPPYSPQSSMPVPAGQSQPQPQAYETTTILVLEDERAASRRALSRFFEAFVYAILLWMAMTLITGGITEAATSHASRSSFFW